MKSVGIHLGVDYCYIVIIELVNGNYICLDKFHINTPKSYTDNGKIYSYIRNEILTICDTIKEKFNNEINVYCLEYPVTNFNRNRKKAIFVECSIQEIFKSVLNIQVNLIPKVSVFKKDKLRKLNINDVNDITKIFPEESRTYFTAICLSIFGLL